MEQNFKNHVKFNPPFHFFAVPILLIGLGFSIYDFVQNPDRTHGLIVFAIFMLMVAIGFARIYALKVQDRVIRTDERLRYYILTNKMLPVALSLSQIIALRFASDEEYATLVDRAIKENLSSKEIKLAVRNWRADHDRV